MYVLHAVADDNTTNIEMTMSIPEVNGGMFVFNIKPTTVQYCVQEC